MNSHTLMTRRRELGEIAPQVIESPLQDPRLATVRNFSPTPVQSAVLLLRRNVWTIVASIVIATSLCLLWAARQPRLYCATAKIAVYRDIQSSVSMHKEYVPEAGDSDEYSVSLETQLHILQSRSLALGVVRNLGLDQDPYFLRNAHRGIVRSQTEAPIPTEAASLATDSLLSGLSVRPVKDSRIVDVSFTGPKPDVDARIVNTLIDGFIEDSIRSRYESATRAANFLSGQLAELRARVEDSQEKLVAYEREHNIVGVNETQNVVTSKLDDLNKQLTLAEADRIEKESLYQTIVAGSLDQIPQSLASEGLQNLRLREADLKNEYAQASTIYGPNYPKVVELSNRIKAMNASIQAELKRLEGRAHEEYQASLRREQKLREVFNAQKIEANRLSESAIQYGLLKREVDSNRQLYDNLQERMKEAGIAAGLRSSNIRLIDPAEAPSVPVSPNLPKSGSIGLFLGFLTAAGVIGMREGMNRSLRNPAEVESFTAMPSLAVIPLHARAKGTLNDKDECAIDAVCFKQPQSAIAEAYRALGTSIMLASTQLKTLLVTSPLPDEGKTMTAMNSAIVLAQQGKRVLLVDADLRKPTLHRGLGLSNGPGLSSILLGICDPANAIINHESLPTLSISCGGPAQRMPAELLGSPKMRELMSLWRQQYDYVIVDTPPVLAVTDAIRLSSQADSMLLIMRSGQTTRDALARSCDLLNQAHIPVLGIVINAVNMRSGGYYGYYPELARNYYRENQAPS